MRYKVFDLIENKYIKDNKLCLKPNGKIVINDCGDEINISNSNISIKFYPTEFKAENYPNCNIEIKPVQSGDTIYIFDTNPVTVGDKYKNYPAKVCEIFYMPKSRWRFWKRKQQLGYMVRWN